MPCNHIGDEPIQVGQYQVYASGLSYIRRGLVDLEDFDVLVPLERRFSYDGDREVIPAFIDDYQPPGPEIADILRDQVIPTLEAGKRVLIFCTASHGRSGAVIAGLIALLEPEVEDPVRAVRERHCDKAVETFEQQEWVYALHRQARIQLVDKVMTEVDDPC